MHPLYRHASPMPWDGKGMAVGEGFMVVDPAASGQIVRMLPHLAPGSATPAIAGNVVVVSYHDEWETTMGGAMR